jgi:hypothetical protein
MVGVSGWEGVVSTALKRDIFVGKNSDEAQENICMSNARER